MARIFIGSSSGSKSIAKVLEVALEAYEHHCTVWDLAFTPAAGTLEELIRNLAIHDFGVFIFSADDAATIRGVEHVITRDNVVYEAGLFTGGLGKDRTFVACPKGVADLRLLTDLAGIGVVYYDAARFKTEPRPAISSAATLINEGITNSGWMTQRPNLIVSVTNDKRVGTSFALKFRVDVTNNGAHALCIESRSFALRSLALTLKYKRERAKESDLLFFVGRDDLGKDMHSLTFVLEPGASTWAWLQLEAREDVLQAAVDARNVGLWTYRCTWLSEPPRSYVFTQSV